MRLQGEERAGDRRNPFDVLSERVGRFLLAFLSLWVTMAAIVSYSRIVTAENPPLAWHETATIIIVAAAITVGIAIPLAIALVEGIPMVFAHFIRLRHREEGRAEGRAQGREEGRKETQALWAAWNERRQQAERDGQSFDEPPPTLGTSENSNGASAR